MPLHMVEREGVAFLAWHAIAHPHGFSTRNGGVSQGIYQSMNIGSTRGDDLEAVAENYRRLCHATGCDVSRIAMANQVHGDVVRAVTQGDIKQNLFDPEGYEADGLVTDVPGLTLVCFSADCIPVLLCDPRRQVVAALHAGWRGTALSIVARGVEKMVALYGCHPGDILAAIGPGIDQCCFETHADVPNALTQSLGKLALPHIHTLEGGKFQVDLKAINRDILVTAGLSPSQIALSRLCTACLPQQFWSHRVTQGMRGSQGAMIMLNGRTE